MLISIIDDVVSPLLFPPLDDVIVVSCCRCFSPLDDSFSLLLLLLLSVLMY